MKDKFIRSTAFVLLVVLFVTFTIRPCLAQKTSSGGAVGTSIGQNVGQPVYWDDEAAYVDIFMKANPWSGPVDSYGYPIAGTGQQWTLFYVNGQPAGNYNFYGEGAFTLGWSGYYMPYGGPPNYSFVPGTYQHNGNVTTGQLQIQVPPIDNGSWNSYTTPAGIQLFIIATDPNNPPRNFHLIRPDYPAWPNTGALFGPEFLQSFAPFCAIRFMGWMNTNIGYGQTTGIVTNWASRPQPNVFGCNGQGACYENMIALCNATGCDLWINVPLYATDDWAQNMAQLIQQNLNPNLHVYLEYCNECWNWGFGQWPVVEAWDQSNSALTDGQGSWSRHGQETAYLLMHFVNIFQPVLGSRLRPILAGQFGVLDYCSGGLQWIQQTYGPPANFIYGIAAAPYFGATSGSDLNTLFASINDYLNTNIQPGIVQNVALANQYGVKYCSYEWGQGLMAGDPSSFPVLQQCQYDPRMGVAYTTEMNMMQADGTALNCHLLNCAIDTNYGYWGAIQDAREISNPPVKYAALAAFAANCNCGNAAVTPPPSNPSKSSGSGSSSSGSSGQSGSSSSSSSNSGSSAVSGSPANTPGTTPNTPSAEQMMKLWTRD